MIQLIKKYVYLAVFLILIGLSFIFNYETGKIVGENFVMFTVDMFKVLPCAFILIGLFEVWVKRETVEKHLGKDAGFKSHIWAILLSSTIVGGIIVAFPVAYTLQRKGARLAVIFTYLGAAAICRIPMAVFESSFLGIKFTVVRILTSIPLVIISSVLIGKYLEKKEFRLQEGK